MLLNFFKSSIGFYKILLIFIHDSLIHHKILILYSLGGSM
jgi:hypothetical protein